MNLIWRTTARFAKLPCQIKLRGIALLICTYIAEICRTLVNPEELCRTVQNLAEICVKKGGGLKKLPILRSCGEITHQMGRPDHFDNFTQRVTQIHIVSRLRILCTILAFRHYKGRTLDKTKHGKYNSCEL